MVVERFSLKCKGVSSKFEKEWVAVLESVVEDDDVIVGDLFLN